MASLKKFDAVVIGAGPGGYVCAIRLGQLGRSTLLVEKDRLGGECLNYGCIPSKGLISASKLLERIRKASDLGIEIGAVSLNLGRLQEWKRAVVDRLAKGIARLCEAAGVEVLNGDASFTSGRTVKVVERGVGQEFEAASVVIAAGSRPSSLPGIEFDGSLVVSSKEALEVSRVPERLLVIGGGVVGLEMGTMFAKMGSKVTVVEIMDQLLPGLEPDLVDVVSRGLRKLGVTTYLGSSARTVERQGSMAKALVATPTSEVIVQADLVLLSVGRKPNSSGLNLERAGVKVDGRGFIPVNERLQTNVSNIYAIGDVRGAPFLAHKASKEGVVAAEVIAGLSSALEFSALPDVIFTDPEIARVGLTERDAREMGRRPMVGRFPFAASGRALTTGEAEGFVRVVADADTRRLLGVQMVGPEASDLIAEAALALEMGASVEDMALTIHAHPTLPEALMEAAEDSLGRAIHIPVG